MVAKLSSALLVTVFAAMLVGCGDPQGRDLSKVEAQPSADVEKAKNAKSLDEWAAANPNNGAPGH